MIRKKDNASDSFTMPKNFMVLEKLLRDGAMLHPLSEWFIQRGVPLREFESGECRSVEHTNSSSNKAAARSINVMKGGPG